MASKDSNISTLNKNKETIKKVSSKVHNELLSTSHLFIDETVATLTRMQRITGKVIKKSEPILEKQIEITFEAVEAIKEQAGKGGKRALKLFGLTKSYNKLSNTISETIDAIPSTEKMMKDTKEFVASAKSDVEEKMEELGKMVKIGDSEKVNTAKTTVAKTAKKVGAKTKAAKSSVKRVVSKAKTVKTTASKTTPTKATTKAKTVAKKATAKVTKTAKKVATPAKAKATPVAKKVTTKATAKKTVATAKATVAKKKTATKPTAAKATTTKTAVKKASVATSELTQIKGIGASLAAIMTDNGIKTIKDLQTATPTTLKIIATKAGNRYKAFDTKNWIEAANAISK